MKRYIHFLNLIIVFSVFFGCSNISDLKVPKKVSVKASPSYDVCLGDIEVDLSKSFNIVDLVKEKTKESGMVGYDYNPGELSKDVQQVLVKKTLMEIPVDINSYFQNNSNITGQLNKDPFLQEITIPNIDLDNSLPVSLVDLNKSIVDLVKFKGSTAGGLMDIDLGEASLYESMSFDSGYLVITTKNDYSDNTVELRYNNQLISSAEFSGNKARIDLTGKTIYFKNMEINFYPKRDFTIFDGVIEDGQINTVTGLTAADLKVPLDSKINTKSAFECFEDCTVGEGEVRFTIETDETWKNVEFDYPLTVSGGIEGTTVLSGTNAQKLDLSGKTILPQDTAISSELVVKAKNSTINFKNAPYIKSEVDIRSIQSVSIELENVNNSQTIPSPLPDEFLKTVKKIKFGRSVIPVDYVNTLPAGNDSIKIKVVSDFFGIDDTQEMLSDKPQGKLVLTSKEQSKEAIIKENPEAEGEYNSIEFKVDVELPGSSAAKPNRVALKNVKPGETYKVGMNFDTSKIDIVWDELTLDTSDFGQKDTINTNLDLNGMLSDLYSILMGAEDAKVSIDKVGLYLYVAKPAVSAMENLKFNGKLSVYTNPDDDAKCKYLLGSKTEKAVMPFSDLPKLDIVNDVVISDIANVTNSAYVGLEDLLNNYAEGDALCVDYDLNFSSGSSEAELVITPDMLDSSVQNNITIDAYIVLPLKISFDKDVYLEFIGETEDSSDLLGRTEASDKSIFENIFGPEGKKVKIRDAAFAYKTSKKPLMGETRINIRYGEGETEEIFDSSLDSGKFVIDDLDNLMKVYPLVPTVKLLIPAEIKDSEKEVNWVSIPREFVLKSKVNLSMTLDIDEFQIIGGEK